MKTVVVMLLFLMPGLLRQASAADPQRVFLAGATGGSGRALIPVLLDAGYKVRGLTRSAAPKDLPDAVEWVEGDVKDPVAMRLAAAGAEIVIWAVAVQRPLGDNNPEAVEYRGLVNTVDAARAAGARRFIMLSSIGVGETTLPINQYIGNVLVWKWLAEDYLRRSTIPYTIVRAASLRNGPPGQARLRIVPNGNSGQGPIVRSDLARVVVEALKRPQAVHSTFAVFGEPGPDDGDWRGAIAGLTAERHPIWPVHIETAE